jgi:hypothetical protein
MFLYLTASILVAEFLAPIAAAALMKYGDWLPFILALAMVAIATAMTVPLPETLHLRDLPEPHEIEGHLGGGTIHRQPPAKSRGHSLKEQLLHLRDALRFLKRDYTIALVVFAFMANRLGRQSLNLLLRYASQRYDWTIRQVRCFFQSLYGLLLTFFRHLSSYPFEQQQTSLP